MGLYCLLLTLSSLMLFVRSLPSSIVSIYSVNDDHISVDNADVELDFVVEPFPPEYGLNDVESIQDQSFSAKTEEINQNFRPIIGVLAQELSTKMVNHVKINRTFNSYIAASYVKFLESAGARVVPVFIRKMDEYYENLGRSLNGFLLPGGGVFFDSDYTRAARKIFNIVQERANLNQGPIPLWGTCLGFENLAYFFAEEDPLTKCSASNRADPLTFQSGYEESQLFGDISEEILESLSTLNITSNFHRMCVLPQTFYLLGLNDSLRILSTSKDKNGLEYISTFEHVQLPIFGTQWHPEKAAFEWASDPKHTSIPHNIEAIRASQALAEVFVQKARQNTNHFASSEEEEANLIYNFAPTFVKPFYNSSFQQCYFFD